MKPLDLSWTPPKDRRRVAASFRHAARMADQQGLTAARDGRLHFAQLVDELDSAPAAEESAGQHFEAHLLEHIREDVAGDDQPGVVRVHQLRSEGAFT